MSKVTEAERELIEELLSQDKNDLTMEGISFLTGRSIRTIYYVAAEMRRKQESYKLKPSWKRLLNRFTKGDDYEKENTTRIRTARRAEI